MRRVSDFDRANHLRSFTAWLLCRSARFIRPSSFSDVKVTAVVGGFVGSAYSYRHRGDLSPVTVALAGACFSWGEHFSGFHGGR